MGEVVVNGDGGMEFEVQEVKVETEKAQQAEKITRQKITAEGGGNGAAEAAGASSLVSWERFLPRMVVSVLLVEADDSTRQIIAALLRKCSYRVAAVPDGLKAWELLKGTHNIDLILTEVELPSISGYALLTLIMEHEACKNIPVIMMSSNDSVSTVYKCMLRGAADFLVKPVRKNELRNLWQHVWRKQASSTGAGLGPPDESAAQEKDEATAENNAVSNHSSGYMSPINRNKECIEKGSDAQSSCTKPELGTETEDTKHVQHFSMPKSDKCLSNEINIPTQEEHHRQGRQRQAHGDENGESHPLGKMNANYGIPQAAENSHGGCEPVNIVTRNNIVPENSSREAIDLIGAFDNQLESTFGCSGSNGGATRFNVLPLLDLSLRGSHPSGSANQVNDERHGLNHSDTSPFSRYISKSLQLRSSTALSTTCNQQKDPGINSEKQPSNHHLDCNSDTHGPAVSSPKRISVVAVQKEQHENTFSHPQNGELSNPIPVRGVIFEDLVNGYGSVVPSIYCAQVGSSPLPSPGTTQHSEPFPQLNAFYCSDSQPLTSQPFHSLVDQRISNSIEQTDNKQGVELEKLEDQGHVSTGNDQSTNGSFCNGDVGRVQSMGSGSNENTNAAPPILKIPSEVGNEESFHVHEGSSRRSIQREAALTKFRLKRKDRCFEKKVRYESRQKLAEQRPRVKGQFVRQVPKDPQPGSSSTG